METYEERPSGRKLERGQVGPDGDTESPAHFCFSICFLAARKPVAPLPHLLSVTQAQSDRAG